MAELVGTLGLVYVGTGAIAIDAQTNALGRLGTSAAFGLVAAAVVMCIGRTSGAHINPAVTVALWLKRRVEGKDLLGYFTSQLLGATIASFMVFHSFGSQSVGVTLPENGDAHSAILTETVLTFLLVYVILVASSDGLQGPLSGLAVGSAVGFGSLSGASMNPARSFGPAIVSGNFSFHWIYWLGPTLGAVIAVIADSLERLPRGRLD